MQWSILVLELLAQVGLESLHELLPKLWIQPGYISFNLQKSTSGNRFLHIDEIDFSFSPVLEIFQKQQLLEEEGIFFVADFLLEQGHSHRENEIEQWTTWILADRSDQGLVKLWNQILLEELQIDVYLRLCCSLWRIREGWFLLLGGDSLLSKVLDGLLKDLLKNLLEHLPGICDFIHDLAEHFETQEHVEDYFGIVSQNFIFLDHLFVQPLVENSFFWLTFYIFDALFQVRIFSYSL